MTPGRPSRPRTALAATVALGLLLGGCGLAPQRELLAVGTCVVSDARGTNPVPCDQAHTHKVIAIAATPEDCPPETVMGSSPADPDDGTITECFAADARAAR